MDSVKICSQFLWKSARWINLERIILFFTCILFTGCLNRKNYETISESCNKNTELIENSLQNELLSENCLKDVACFDLVYINYCEDKYSLYPSGEVFMIFKNCQVEQEFCIYKILTSAMPVIGIEKFSDEAVSNGDLFKVSTFLPGGGEYYKVSFIDNELLIYKICLDELSNKLDTEEYKGPEYELEKNFNLNGISKVKLENIVSYANP